MTRTPQHLSRSIAFNPSSRPAAAHRRTVLTVAALALAVMAATLLPAGPAQAQQTQTVPSNWSLIPSGTNNQPRFTVGQKFRLLFVTSTGTNARSTQIAYYNNFVQARAAANPAISGVPGLSAKFRALITTSTVHAIDNIGTNGMGVPIYWLGGAKVADDYVDFHDNNGWDSQAGKTETGSPYSSGVWTGSLPTGRRHSSGFTGDGQTIRGRLNIGATNEINAEFHGDGQQLPLYALSPVLTVGVHISAYGVDVWDFKTRTGRDGKRYATWWAQRHGKLSCRYRLEWRASTSHPWQGVDFTHYGRRPSYTIPDSTHQIRLFVRGYRDDPPLLVAGHGAPGQQSTRGDVGVIEAPALPALSVADAQAAEGGTLSFAVTLSAAASGPVTVDWTTADGTATAGTDYTAATGALTFAAGETAKTVTVATLADTAQEETETLTLTLSNPSGATLADAGATGSITNVAPPQQREPEPQTGERSGEAETEVVETPPLPALTARIVAAPSAHGGKGKAFNVRVGFSAAVTVGATKAVRAGTVQVGNGRVTRSTRVDGQRDLWEFRIKPGSHGDVTVTLAEADCAAAGAICTKDGRKLSSALALTVSSPASLSVADARAREGTDATIAFAVTLSRAAADAVTVRYATRDGTAKKGKDYRRAKGTLTFAAGETAKTVSVTVLDDAHDEGEETFTLLLRKASGAAIADGAATGTIENADPLQRAWLARFGRTVATHVTDAVGARLRGTPEQASHLTIGGYRVPLGQPAGRDAEREGGPPSSGAAPDPEASASALLHGLAGVLGLGPGGATPDAAWRAPSGPDPRLGQGRPLPAVRLRDVLQGSAFRLNLSGAAADAATPRLTAWGRFAGTTFDGREGDLTLDGDVFTGTVGVDGAWDRVLAGIAVAHSRGDGGFTMPGTEERGQGDLEQTLTSLHPYLRYAVTDRLDVWGLVGYGWGEVDLDLATGETLETDTTLVMGSFGGRGILLTPGDTGGFQLATRTDAMLTRTSSDTVAGLEGTDADAHRVRLILEGSRGFTWADGRSLTPTAELGVRHDWGDAETGFGLEVGGRVQYADPALGLTIEGAVRGLLAHEDTDYEEWGASGTVRLAPGLGGQGLSLTLAPTWGAAASGIDGLWARQTTAGLASPGRTQAPGGRLQAEIGYGVPAFGTGLLTPYAGTVLSDGADRTYRVGARWASVTGLALTLEGLRQESPGQQPVNQGLQLQLGWGF